MPSKYSSDLSSVYVGGEREKTSLMPSDVVDVLKLPQSTYVRIRLIGGVMTTGSYWVSTYKKDNSVGQFNIGCNSWNPDTNSQEDDKEDPWRDFERAQIDAGIGRNERLVRFSRQYFMNCIVRNLQESEPSRKPPLTANEKETGFKEKDSDSWTPVRVISLPVSVIDQIQKLKAINVVKLRKKDGTTTTKTFDMNHPKYGCDILIMYDPSKSGTAKYSVNKADGRSPLSEDEQKYLTWDLDNLYEHFNENVMKDAFDSWARRNASMISDSFNDSDHPEYAKTFVKSKKKTNEEFETEYTPSKKSKRSKVVEDEDIDDSGFDEDDVTPKKVKKSSEPLTDDEYFGGEEEEKPKKKPARKSKSAVEEDDDFEDDFEDDFGNEDDDFEEEKPKKKPAKKSKPAVEDDFEDDDFEEEKPKKKPARKSKSAVEEDDDFEDDFEDEDF